MGVYLGAIMVGVPGIIFLVYCLTPKGRRGQALDESKQSAIKRSRGQRSRGQVFDLFPKDKNRETEVSQRGFRFFASWF